MRLPKNEIVIVNTKVGSVKILLRHMIGKHDLEDNNDNGERCMDIWGFHRLVIGDTSFEHLTCHKVSLISIDRQSILNQIDHIVISSRFRSCLLYMPNDSDIDLERDHHLMMSCLRFRVLHLLEVENLDPSTYLAFTI